MRLLLAQIFFLPLLFSHLPFLLFQRVHRYRGRVSTAAAKETLQRSETGDAELLPLLSNSGTGVAPFQMDAGAT